MFCNCRRSLVLVQPLVTIIEYICEFSIRCAESPSPVNKISHFILLIVVAIAYPRAYPAHMGIGGCIIEIDIAASKQLAEKSLPSWASGRGYWLAVYALYAILLLYTKLVNLTQGCQSEVENEGGTHFAVEARSVTNYVNRKTHVYAVLFNEKNPNLLPIARGIFGIVSPMSPVDWRPSFYVMCIV